jgi:preprotein translocase subunit SecY
MQLLTIAIPALEELQRDGEEGKKKIAEITRYVTVGLALFESSAMTYGFYKSGYLVEKNALSVIMIVAALTAGSTVLMWIGERITEKGVGNGISIVLVINIISRIPADLSMLGSQFVSGKSWVQAILAIVIIAVILIGMVVFVIVLQGGERKIPVQYSKKVVGRKMVGGSSSSIPMKVNTAGVMPIIFASSIMSLPSIVTAIVGKTPSGFAGEIINVLNTANWLNPSKPIYSIGLLLYIFLVVFFAYFYTSISFNPIEIADNMKKQGGFVPGIRPGRPTSEYISKVMSRITLFGAIFLAAIAVLPAIIMGITGLELYFGGTALLIVVGVALDTMKQLEASLLMRSYEGFMK